MEDLLKRCAWPNLPERYDRALREAVTHILERYTPVGIIAAGSILRGTPNRSSDLDIYVLHLAPYRQRLQKFFNDVPAEIFVNPPAAVEGYFTSEGAASRPITAHMLVHGFVILDQHPVVGQLRQRAQDMLATPPNLSAAQHTWKRYLASNLLEDAVDVAVQDPQTAQIFLAQAVFAMLQYHFEADGHFIPRTKELLTQLDAYDPPLAALARRFYSSGDYTTRLAAAEQIADRTVAVRGFFEWESEPEQVS
jgi:predicted nucleotidyltransferase